MHTSNEVTMQGPYHKIFELASKVEDWGHILPHYRYVRVLKRHANRKWVRMSAWRTFIPVAWSAIETVEVGTAEQPGRILFHHIGGLVRGMDVEWSFQRKANGAYVVKISHQLDNPPFPTRILGPKLVEMVVGRGFIGYIAGKTLHRIKYLVEQD